MERFAAEALQRDRDHAIKAALKAKVPIFEIMADFGLSEAEIGKIIVDQSGGPRRDDVRDARSEGKEVILPNGRRGR